jgi:hypothetical protein
LDDVLEVDKERSPVELLLMLMVSVPDESLLGESSLLGLGGVAGLATLSGLADVLLLPEAELVRLSEPELEVEEERGSVDDNAKMEEVDSVDSVEMESGMEKEDGGTVGKVFVSADAVLGDSVPTELELVEAPEESGSLPLKALVKC